MKKNDTFKIKKGAFSNAKKLEILEKYIAPFLSKNNAIKIRSNGSGPSPISSHKVIKNS